MKEVVSVTTGTRIERRRDAFFNTPRSKHSGGVEEKIKTAPVVGNRGQKACLGDRL